MGVECILGGVSWDEVVWPLVQDAGPVMGIVFVSYIAFSHFVMMNMITGVFVESALEMAREEDVLTLAHRIAELFMTGEDAHKPEVTFEEFKEKLDTPQMKEYFKAVHIDPSEAAGIFKLLDMDNNGHLDRQEIVSGCLRLRGTAQALELSLLVYQITQMYNDMVEN